MTGAVTSTGPVTAPLCCPAPTFVHNLEPEVELMGSLLRPSLSDLTSPQRRIMGLARPTYSDREDTMAHKSGPKYSRESGKEVESEMRRFKRGTARSGWKGWKSKEPQAGDRDCAVQGEKEGRKGAQEEIICKCCRRACRQRGSCLAICNWNNREPTSSQPQ